MAKKVVYKTEAPVVNNKGSKRRTDIVLQLRDTTGALQYDFDAIKCEFILRDVKTKANYITQCVRMEYELQSASWTIRHAVWK